MEKENIKDILNKIGKKKLTDEEEAKAKLWLFQLNLQEPSGLSDHQIQDACKQIWTKLEHIEKRKPSRKIWISWAATAAAVLILIGGGMFYLNHQSTGPGELIYGNDIVPGTNGATLTLADGTTILISDTLTGNIAQQSGVSISKDIDGQIIYEILGEETNNIAYNILTTAAGEQSKVKLPDGTLVFLNTASSLRYPTSFANAPQRKVYLTGESYFQVKEDQEQPFVVETERQRVEVLGTRFNLNTYDPSLSITTLEEGSIRVSMEAGTKLIYPGEQSLNDGTSIKVVDADLEQVLGWTNGNFIFMGASIQTVMKQLERWYDVEVVYDGPPVEGLFYANISRNKNLSEILKVLQKTNAVHFSIQGRRILVSK